MSSDPAHRLYDAACDLLLDAQALREAARSPDVGDAVPATLGCLAETIAVLAESSLGLRQELRRTRTAGASEALDGLAAAFQEAERACASARAATARAAEMSGRVG